MVAILVVEDELIPAYALATDLEELGYSVSGVVDTAELAITHVQENAPDLLLVDIRLRGSMDGLQLADKVQQFHHLPIIFITAFSDAETLQQAGAVSAYGYLTKPLRIEDLKATIAIALAKHKVDRQTQLDLAHEKERSEMAAHFLELTYHDLRTPLTTLLLASDRLASSQFLFENTTLGKQTDRINQAVTKIHELFIQATTLNRSEIASMTCEPALMQLAGFCSSLIQELQEITKQKCVIRLVCERGNLAVKLDKILLWHILSNLLINAVKYSDAGSEVEMEIIYSPDWITFRVCDRGIGIPPENIKDIFQPFKRGANVEHIAGKGIGLYAVKQAVDRHGGEIEVDSPCSQGTIFTVRLPKCN